MSTSRAEPVRQIRLLLLTDTAVSGQGGSEGFLRNLVGRLPGALYRIEVMQLAAEPAREGQVASLGEPDHLQCSNHPVSAVYGAAGRAAYMAVRRRVLAGEVDIVQSQHEKSDIINALLPRGPCATIRISNRRDLGFQKTRKVRAAFRLLSSRFDQIVAPTPAIIDSLQRDEGARAGRMQCIPNGVDTDRFAPCRRDSRSGLRSALGYDDEHIVFGCVASLTPVKRHHDLLLAFARLLGTCPLARLVLIGDGPLRSEIEAQIATLGLGAAVRLLGVRADVERVLPALDIGTLCSSTEGLSNAILEAQACGLPTIVTAVGGNVDLVVPEENGLLVPALAPDKLADALIRGASDPGWRLSAGLSARKRVVENHSMEAMVRSYEELYLSLLRSRHDSRIGRELR